METIVFHHKPSTLLDLLIMCMHYVAEGFKLCFERMNGKQGNRAKKYKLYFMKHSFMKAEKLASWLEGLSKSRVGF